MPETYYTGVDGGMTGAIAILTDTPGLFDCLILVDIPMLAGKSKKPWYNASEIHRLFRVKPMIVGLEESYPPKIFKRNKAAKHFTVQIYSRLFHKYF